MLDVSVETVCSAGVSGLALDRVRVAVSVDVADSELSVVDVPVCARADDSVTESVVLDTSEVPVGEPALADRVEESPTDETSSDWMSPAIDATIVAFSVESVD